MRRRNAAAYDPNDKRQTAHRGNASRALSPRTVARPRSADRGTYGTAVSGGSGPYDPTSGRHGSGAGARRSALNTMTNRKNAGTGRIPYPVNKFDPAEVGHALTTAPMAPPMAGRRLDSEVGGIPAVKAAAQSEGIRQTAMARRSVLITTGAVDRIDGHGPVWLQETNQHDHMTYGPARETFSR